MNKGIITISVEKNITQEEINEIRKTFKNSEHYKDYILNIMISGNEDMKVTLGNFLKERLNY